MRPSWGILFMKNMDITKMGVVQIVAMASFVLRVDRCCDARSAAPSEPPWASPMSNS